MNKHDSRQQAVAAHAENSRHISGIKTSVTLKQVQDMIAKRNAIGNDQDDSAMDPEAESDNNFLNFAVRKSKALPFFAGEGKGAKRPTGPKGGKETVGKEDDGDTSMAGSRASAASLSWLGGQLNGLNLEGGAKGQSKGDGLGGTGKGGTNATKGKDHSHQEPKAKEMAEVQLEAADSIDKQLGPKDLKAFKACEEILNKTAETTADFIWNKKPRPRVIEALSKKVSESRVKLHDMSKRYEEGKAKEEMTILSDKLLQMSDDMCRTFDVLNALRAEDNIISYADSLPMDELVYIFKKIGLKLLVAVYQQVGTALVKKMSDDAGEAQIASCPV